MANQLEMSKVKAILTLRDQGWSFVRIAKELGIHRETVARYVRQHADSEPPKPSEVHTGSDDSKPTQLHTGSAPIGRSVCEPFRELIESKLQQGLSAVRIHQDLVHEHDFQGSYYAVMRFVRRYRTSQQLPVRRVESPPGDEAQVDFGTGAPLITEEGRRLRTHVLRVVLSYSRKAYSEVVRRQSTEDFLRCLENAFWHFGGVPQTLVIDNLRAAVTRADWYEPELNPKLLAFSEHYGVIVLPTKPRTPQHKGKVEAGVKYVQNNALKGRTFSSLADQNQHLERWETSVADTRIHGTTQRQVRLVFEQEERHTLKPLPQERFPFFHEGQRKVHRDGHVEVDKAYYTVPPEYYRRTVWVRWDSRLVRIFNKRLEQIAMHVKQLPGKFSTDPAHIVPEKMSAMEHGTTTLLEKASTIGEHANQWAQTVIRQRGIQGTRSVLGLLRLTDKYRASEIDKACEIAASYQAYQLKQVRKLLKKQAPKQEQFEFMDDHPIIRSMDIYGDLVQAAIKSASLDAQHDTLPGT